MSINTGASPIDTNTMAGQIRLLVGDTDPEPLDAGTGTYAWYSDEELEALCALNDDSPKRTAIWVLSQVAISQAMLLKKWTSDDLAVDGPAIAKGIENTIARLSKQIMADESRDDESFDVYAPAHTAYVQNWF